MSTGPRPQAAFIQGNQSMVEQDASHSALFYLFQEVSKLSSSTRSVTNSNSVWLNDRSRPDNCIVKKEKDGAFSFQTCQHSLSLMSAYSHINGVNDESPSSDITTLVEPHHDCNSTWKVLTLINLQCERLMHRRDEEDAVSSSVSSVTKLPKGQPTAKLLTTDVTEQDIRSDSVSTEYALRPSTLRYEIREITASVSPVEDVRKECSQSQWRTKTPRKQPHPSRSVDIQDPDLQGVTFRMDTEVDDNMEQCRLLITSKYSKEFCKSVRKPKLRSRTSQKSLKTSSSEEESDLTTNASKDKVCASCCTRKTPMWRDAEDGTPLCNACGIRYKKYRVRCVKCWHIPKKEGNSNSCCLKCGNFVRLASAQRKHTS
ncbi:hypothetical protein Q8A73_003440 [Channa argus]|nr:hypothetical protein Q8A73_003440 [Channa argus]